MAGCLRRGVMLLVDYGYTRREYYHPQRTTGTLLCHYRHRAHGDPFYSPGLQDITASVDFTAVADYAVAAGLDVKGFTTQVNFLIGCGLDRIVAELCAGSDILPPELSAGVKQLTLPSEMGERCKAIALCRDYPAELCGFAFNNQLQRL